MYAVLLIVVGFSWTMHSNQGSKMEALKTQITAVEEAGDPDETRAKLLTDLSTLEGEKTFNGILLTFLSAGVVGIFFVVHLLPILAQRVTHAVYDSAEMVEKDAMHAARSLVAQGEYEGAIAAFKEAALVDPLNRLPWVEILKIQKDNLHDPEAAIATIRHALESQKWEIDDAAYFLFRLAELYEELQGDRAPAIAIMHQVVEQFPGTRHAANANHKLSEWATADAAAAAQAEEDSFIAGSR